MLHQQSCRYSEGKELNVVMYSLATLLQEVTYQVGIDGKIYDSHNGITDAKEREGKVKDIPTALEILHPKSNQFQQYLQ